MSNKGFQGFEGLENLSRLLYKIKERALLKKKKFRLGNLFIAFATCGYIGLFPWIPGTIGTLMGVLVYLLLCKLHPLLYSVDLITLIFVASWISEKAERLLGEKDSQVIVIDECVGFLVTMLWIAPTLKGIVLGFIFFRILDIIKPPPARWMERHVSGGYGVVFDDVIAGLYSNLLLRGTFFLLG